ncbi:MAG: hypothetical protein K2J88_07510 [Oscillospiraceae bacterium]|nr:hypothetical protein [Oscillospiraceae bacterium]
MNLEEYFDTSHIKGQYQKAVAEATANTLKNFCRQESEFLQAVEQSGKSFQDCLDSVIKGVSKSISDFDVYTRAVKFYFPCAEIRCRMELDLVGNTETAPEEKPFDFMNLMDW